MNLRLLAATFFAALAAGASATVDHDQIEPFPQPDPVTVSEKAAFKFKPQLYIPASVCVPFPAVNAAGEITGGLKGTNGNDACKYAPKGAQVYGRAVVWIDNPDLEIPKIVGVALSKSDTKYHKKLDMWPSYFVGYRMEEGPRFERTYIYGSNASLRFEYKTRDLYPYMDFAPWDGEYHDLIMWEQLTDVARLALNDSESFGKAEVPFSDEHYEDHLDKAWPL